MRCWFTVCRVSPRTPGAFSQPAVPACPEVAPARSGPGPAPADPPQAPAPGSAAHPESLRTTQQHGPCHLSPRWGGSAWPQTGLDSAPTPGCAGGSWALNALLWARPCSPCQCSPSGSASPRSQRFSRRIAGEQRQNPSCSPDRRCALRSPVHRLRHGTAAGDPHGQARSPPCRLLPSSSPVLPVLRWIPGSVVSSPAGDRR